MNLSAVTISEFFTYLKQNPQQHTIPKRYVTRIRGLVFYYFIGWHRFAKDEVEHELLRAEFDMRTTKADTLKTIDYTKFAEMPKVGPGMVEHLKKIVTLFE